MQVLLHPKGHVIQGDDVGLIIAWDLRTAYAISEYGDKHMQKKKWKKKKDRHGVEVQKYRQGPITVSTDLDGVSGELNPQNIPHSPGNRNSLESQMRSAIIRRYDQRGQEDDDGIELGIHFLSPSRLVCLLTKVLAHCFSSTWFSSAKTLPEGYKYLI